MIKIGSILILNEDEQESLTNYKNSCLRLISCGYSHRCTITVSGINEEGFTYCIQREFRALNGDLISPQEFNVLWSKQEENLYRYLEIVTLLMVCGCPSEIFKVLKF